MKGGGPRDERVWSLVGGLGLGLFFSLLGLAGTKVLHNNQKVQNGKCAFCGGKREKEVEELKQQLEESVRRIADMEEKVKNDKQENDKHAREEMERLMREKEEEMGIMWKKEKETLMNEKESLAREMEERSRIAQKDAEETKKLLDNLKKEKDALMNDKDALTRSVEEKSRIAQTEAEETKKMLDNLKKEKDALTSEKDTLARSFEEKSRIAQKDAQETKKMLDNLRKEKDALTSEKDTLARSLEEKSRIAQKDAQETKKMLDNLMKEKDALTSEKETLRREKDNLTHSLEERSKSAGSAQKDSEETKKMLESLRKEKEVLEASLLGLRSDKASADALNLSLKFLMEEAQTSRDGLRLKLDELTNAKNELQNQRNQLRSLLDESAKSLEESEKRMDVAERERKLSEKRMVEFEKAKIAAENEMKRIKADAESERSRLLNGHQMLEEKLAEQANKAIELQRQELEKKHSTKVLILEENWDKEKSALLKEIEALRRPIVEVEEEGEKVEEDKSPITVISPSSTPIIDEPESALNDAKKKVSQLSSRDLSELASYSSPKEIVVDVTTALLKVLQVGTASDLKDWKSMRKFLNTSLLRHVSLFQPKASTHVEEYEHLLADNVVSKAHTTTKCIKIFLVYLKSLKSVVVELRSGKDATGLTPGKAKP